MDHYDKSACLWGLGLVDSFFFILISQIFYRVELTLQAKEMLLETNIYIKKHFQLKQLIQLLPF